MEPTNKTPVTVRLEPDLIKKIEALGASKRWNRSEVCRQAIVAFLNSEGKTNDSKKNSFAEAVYEALVREIESGKLVFLEDPKTQEKIRVLVPIMKQD